MADLLELRGQIDDIDAQIVDLFEKRMDVSRQVAEYKIGTAKKVLDKERENQKLEKLRSIAHGDFNKMAVTELFQQIMASSRKLQYQLLEKQGVRGQLPFVMVDHIEKDNVRVVFQGVEGAYTYQAMLDYFGEDVKYMKVKHWREAMVAIEEGMADYAVLPVENTTAGIVSEMYDLLEEFDNYIVGEKIIPIDHALMGVPGAKLEDIKTVYSHIQAIMQCNHYLNDKHPEWKSISKLNTAMAAQKVAEEGDKTQAAIASVSAAKFHGLEILEEHINDAKNNSTRFIVITNQKMYAKDAKKVSICFELAHESGSLYNILSHFIFNGLNLCKIESRPIPEKNFEYHFFVDFEGNLSESAVKNALRGVREEAINLKILGNY